MTEGVPTLSRDGDFPTVLTSDAFHAVLRTGRSRGSLSMDDVMPVLRDVELSPELITAVTGRIREEGIEFDAGERDLTRARLLGRPGGAAGTGLDQPAGARAPSSPAARRKDAGADGSEGRATIVPPLPGPSTPSGRAPTVPRRARPSAVDRLISDDGALAGAGADPVRFYLKEIGKVPLLSAEEEVALAQRIEGGAGAELHLAERAAVVESGGDPTPLSDADHRALTRQVSDGELAKSKLIEANLRLVVSIA